MPTESIKQKPGEIFIETEDGKIQKLGRAKCVEITTENNDDAIDTMKYAAESVKEGEVEVSGTFNISRESSIQLQKMAGINKITRKRFIKLLMGCGLQRNCAQKFAEIVRESEWGWGYCPLMVQTVIEWCIQQDEKEEQNRR